MRQPYPPNPTPGGSRGAFCSDVRKRCGMCGISGKLYFDPARPVERPVLERMNAVLAHRGPDDAGIPATARSASPTGG